MSESCVIISRARNASESQSRLESALAERLAAEGHCVLIVPHLYDLPPTGPAVQRLRAEARPLAVVSWLHPRAAIWTLHALGVISRPERPIRCLSWRTHGDVASMAAAIGPPNQEQGATEQIDEPASARWYPVIDYDRCTNCMECLNYCLFGVYDLDSLDRLVVSQPNACRDGCPACSRICPAAAILFPEYADPTIAGADQPATSPTASPRANLSSFFSSGPAAPKPTDKLDELVDGLDDWDQK